MDETTEAIIAPEVQPETQPEAEAEAQSDAGAELPEETEAVDAVQTGTLDLLAVDEAQGIVWAPFFVYLALWVVLCVGAVFFLRAAALDGGARWVPEYLYVVYAGIGMMALGPLLSLIVWLVTRARRAPEMRRGLFVASLVKGSVVTFIGGVMWIVALYVLDLYTSGILV